MQTVYWNFPGKPKVVNDDIYHFVPTMRLALSLILYVFYLIYSWKWCYELAFVSLVYRWANSDSDK